MKTHEEKLEAMKQWRRRNPDKVALGAIQSARRACEKFPQLGYAVVEVAPDAAIDAHLNAAIAVCVRNGYTVTKGGC